MPKELRLLAKVELCAGFFVQNSQESNLLITARHCLNYKATEWCQKGGAVYDNDSHEFRKCISMVAVSPDHDIVMMKFGGTQRDNKHNLRLADFSIKQAARVKAIGFPVDKYASEGANTSENCWILDDEPFRDELSLSKDLQLYFNCSIYAGNSGGPVILEGTNIVMGLPATYAGDGKYGNNTKYERLSSVALMADFTERHRQELNSHGVILAQKAESSRSIFQRSYLTTGLYGSSDYPDCDFYIHPVYNTNSYIHELEVDYKCLGANKYICQDGAVCTNENSSITIESGYFYFTSEKKEGSRFTLIL